jgi:hypothetical protein
MSEKIPTPEEMRQRIEADTTDAADAEKCRYCHKPIGDDYLRDGHTGSAFHPQCWQQHYQGAANTVEEDTPEPDWLLFEDISEHATPGIDTDVVAALLWCRDRIKALEDYQVDAEEEEFHQVQWLGILDEKVKALEDTLEDVQAEVIALRGVGV